MFFFEFFYIKVVDEYCLKRNLHFTASEEPVIGHAVDCALMSGPRDSGVCFEDAHGMLLQ